MGFTKLLESLTSVESFVSILSGFGLIAVLLAYLKRVQERSYWRKFKSAVRDWVDRLFEAENRHPHQLTDSEWRAECERMLTDANFSPLEIKELIDLSVEVAKATAADKLFK